jgi:putative FmdB family regulatory protein
MPIYEYACPHCRKIMNFFVRNPASGQAPSCPHCGRQNLERLMSRFAVKSNPRGRASKEGSFPESGGERAGEGSGGGDDDVSPAQAARFEKLMDEMGADIDKIDENDPRQIGRFLRKFGEAAGEDLGPEFREAVGRLEAGEDPEKVEELLGGALGEGEDEGGGEGGSYTRDDTLYDM